MASEGGSLAGMRWAVERPAPDKMEIQLVVDEEAKLSPEVKGAIDRLIGSLQAEGEVSGYLMMPPPRPGGRGGNPVGFDYDTGRRGYDYDTDRKARK